MKTETIEPVRMVKGQSVNRTFEVQRVEVNNDDMEILQVVARTGPYQRFGMSTLMDYRKFHPDQKYRLVHVIKEWDEE